MGIQVTQNSNKEVSEEHSHEPSASEEGVSFEVKHI